MSATRWDYGGREDPAYPKIVSYFTDDLYMAQAFQLARSCQVLGLAYSIERVPDLGSWERNTSHKPEFLLRKAQENPGRAILWLDADARVWRLPELLRGLQTTIAYHRWQGREALSGTVYLSDWDNMRDVVLRGWIQECRKRPGVNDQSCMELSLGPHAMHPALAHHLPVEYCSIFDGVFQLQEPGIQVPVIEHYQASRWARRRGQ